MVIIESRSVSSLLMMSISMGYPFCMRCKRGNSEHFKGAHVRIGKTTKIRASYMYEEIFLLSTTMVPFVVTETQRWTVCNITEHYHVRWVSGTSSGPQKKAAVGTVHVSWTLSP